MILLYVIRLGSNIMLQLQIRNNFHSYVHVTCELVYLYTVHNTLPHSELRAEPAERISLILLMVEDLKAIAKQIGKKNVHT
jgi:hypothetical protein